MKSTLLIITLLFTTLLGFSAERELIKRFQLAPVGLSGRTVEGTWALDSDGLHIKGKWGAVNGLSMDNDYREMDLWIGYLTSETTTKHFPMADGKRTIHECYFYINRLEKTKQGEQGSAHQSTTGIKVRPPVVDGWLLTFCQK